MKRIQLFALITISLLNIGPNILNAQEQLDLNGDGEVNILVLGTNSSINNATIFSPNLIALELQNILSNDQSLNLNVNVIPEDIHLSKVVTIGLGGAGSEFNWTFHSHSLIQYYYWPEAQEERLANLAGSAGIDWDYVVIGADPYFIDNLPGFYSLGVNKIAKKVAEGNAETLLIMMWPHETNNTSSIEHFEEFSYRTADGSNTHIEVVPAGLAWQSLPDEKKDVANIHPSPNGAYLTAAGIYSQLTNQSASLSNYTFDDEIADHSFTTFEEAKTENHYSGIRTFMSPFMSCNIGESEINYNHTGTSSENGILGGLNWVFNQSNKTLQNGGNPPIDFNYGRANSNFEANKRYQVDPSRFDFSFGFPMQDHGNHGNNSMLYGIDRRQSGTLNDTDVGVTRFMIEQSELPYARAVPVRALYAQMAEAIPGQSAYRDSWHMHRNLDKSIGAFMYTLLNGTCVLGQEPDDNSSAEWATWMSHKIGHETAWNLIYLEELTPDCNTLTDDDADGYSSYVDCNDNDQNINPAQEEIIYNGVDDDCDPATLDDDLDSDGFLAADDCDDNNASINPNAAEIPNNGIDEDCDGEDLISSLTELGNVSVIIYPNPTSNIIYLKVSRDIDLKVRLYDVIGRKVIESINVKQIDVSDLHNGSYLLEIFDQQTNEKLVQRILIQH